VGEYFREIFPGIIPAVFFPQVIGNISKTLFSILLCSKRNYYVVYYIVIIVIVVIVDWLAGKCMVWNGLVPLLLRGVSLNTPRRRRGEGRKVWDGLAPPLPRGVWRHPAEEGGRGEG
jgi:hypothetical protein